MVENLQVPAERTFSFSDQSHMDSPVGRMPICCMLSAGIASISLGVAQATLDAVLDLGHTKVPADLVPDLRDKPMNQSAVAETTAKIVASRRHLHYALGSLWRIVETDQTWTADDLAQVWSAAVTTAAECRCAVTAMYEVAGTAALYTDCVIERAHRDMRGILQHAIIRPTWLEQAGAVKFGLEASHPLFGL